MAMSVQRWSAIAESPFPWEREALEYLRERLPDQEPWHAWSNVEFIDDEGKVNEVDALILSPQGLFLVEIKSRPGRLDGDSHTWTWTTDGRRRSDDNPLILANRKAKRLASLLKRQSAVVRARLRVPFIEPVIFLSAADLAWRVDSASAQRTFGRRPSSHGQGIINALTAGLPSAALRAPVDAAQARMVCRAIEEAGIRPSLRDRRIGDYELTRIIAEGDGWQDWEGRHVSLGVPRRVRMHPYTAAAGEEARRALGRLAAREFQILEGVDHPGVLKVREYKDTDRGPALIFDHDPKAIRLDFLMREHLERMGVDLRLHIVRQLAETLKHAHAKRLYHRALSPQSILVRDVEQAYPRLQIMNWRTAARDASTSGTAHVTAGTVHLEDYVEDPAKVYIAPEALRGGPESGPHHDVFSLAAIAYHLFTGQPPAASPLDLATRLRAGGGLRVSDVVDGAMQSLVDLIRLGTHPEVASRIASMDEFLEYLADVERDLQQGTPEATVDPSVAKPGDRLEGGFTVIRRLGRGASADALLVRCEDDPEESVLKVAVDAAHSDRLQGEAAALAKLHHTNIVTAKRTVAVAGRAAILLENAGTQTLAQHLRNPEGLSLDLKRRFGEELLSAVDHLEQKGIAHRDIKPDNIGITEGRERKRLVLFDFSLARTPADNIQAGTRPYLDPFLSLRRPPRWDLSAERFAAAVTLHEMMTGMLPSWGDGQSDPALIDDEATIESGRIDPHLREGLTAFFDKALRRDPRERFDNAEDMLRAWRRVFDDVVTNHGDEDSFDAMARRATAQTPIADLGYGVEAQDVLDRMGVHTVRDLLTVHRRSIRYLPNVGDRIRKEIRLKAKRLAQLRPDLVPGASAPTDSGAALDPGVPSIDRLAELLVPRRPLGDETAEDRVLAVFLGLEATEPPPVWPTVGQVAGHCGMVRTAVAAALTKGRERWHKQPWLTALREDLRTLLRAHGGVMTAKELVLQVLAMRGSALTEEDERVRLAGAVLRAATDAEGALAEPRFLVFEDEAVPLVAETLDLAIHAQTLGRTADALAMLDPLAPPQRVLEDLEMLGWPEASPRPAPNRVRALAVAASRQAALSSKGEVYPRGMPADRTLRLAAGSLLGPRVLTEAQVRERVLGRYAEAAPLPGRPTLDRLLEDAGAGRVWLDNGEEGAGYYTDQVSLGASTGVSSIHRLMTDGPAVEQTPEVTAAQHLEERMGYALRTGGFLALTVDPRRYLDAERALLDRFPLQRVSVDRLLLDAMRIEAVTRKVDWSLVLRADAADPQSRDWTNLQRLIGFAVPKVEQTLRTSTKPLLLVDCGLFARYDLMDRLQTLRDASGTAGGLPGLWLLLPLPDGGLPTIAGKAVPVISSSQWARIPTTWIVNAHRAGTRPAA
ncbi:BREX system serine/threonine kinase PglW [Azospirillum brasilense]|uniref:BREX system serine/threonine kinase PglW n=1 Tax=Azospirillum brasilense TaxID=192 RepID=UPI000E6886EB|nr:BREX system serine/threonine kinase PglW [Azospirillum brasilense]NUB25304.1 BREX system serine/threonine kinase PglW [Azospirillum brasilense]NUB33622.1 BREX system serine/threonine kinase PglW [Azospirillum brasilense]RIW01504.1 BREX system serine/threonine kinase PglW [Azospirillum brasilense]